MKHPCAIKDFNKTSDQKKSYGQGQTLNPTFASLFPDEIKHRHEHQNKVCDTHARRIRRRLESFANDRMTLLTSAVDQVLNTTPVLSTQQLSPTQPVSTQSVLANQILRRKKIFLLNHHHHHHHTPSPCDHIQIYNENLR